jgi:hypothetical protein
MLRHLEKRNGWTCAHLSERLEIRASVFGTPRLSSRLVSIGHRESTDTEVAGNSRYTFWLQNYIEISTLNCVVSSKGAATLFFVCRPFGNWFIDI